MTRPLLTTVVFLALFGVSHAGAEAAGPTGLDDFRITHWDKTGGAPGELVLAMTQDREGYLWLGSADGLTRFDGFTFERWNTRSSPLAGTEVRTLFVDLEGAVWVGFDQGGISRISGRQVRNYGVADGLPMSSVRAFVQDREGAIWAASLGGLFTLRQERWEAQPIGPGAQPPVLSAIYDSTGSLFISTPDAVFRLRAASTSFEMIDAHQIGRGVHSLCKDGDGHVVTTDPVVGVRILNGTPEHTLPPTSGVGLKAVCARNGTIWVGTRLTGLWRMEPTGPGPATQVVQTGLLSQAALSVLEDRDQNIWVGSSAGLYRLTPRNVRTLPEAGVPTAVTGDNLGRMWVGTVSGLFQFTRHQDQWVRSGSHLPGATVRSLHAAANGLLWVASPDGIMRLARDGTPLPTSWGPAFRQVTSFTSNADGTVWFYDEQRGLHRFRHEHPEPLELAPDLLGIARTVLHADRRNRLWLVGDGGVEVRGADGDVRRYTTGDGLQRALYRSIFEDREGIIWLGSTSGLSRLIDGRIESINIAVARRTSWIRAIVEDRQGRLWLAIDRGGIQLSRASFQNALRTPTQVLSDGFEVFDGLPGTIRALSDRVGTRTHNDQLWFTTDEGLAIIDPDANLPELGLVPSRITSAMADDVRLDPVGTERLGAGTTRLHVSWTALDLTSSERVQFRYRLDGIDRGWLDAGTAREAEYANLGAGSYVFRVAARREGTTWNDASDASWEFTIAPHFYQTVWFPFLAAAIVASVSWGTWHMRLAQTRRRFAITLAERARVSREVHDTLLQSLVGVSLQCQALAESGESGAIADRLVQLRRRIDEHIEEGRELIWNLRSPTLEKYDLVSALRRIADDIVAGTSVKIELTISGKAQSCSPRAEREILRIGQEAITNAVRHGRPTVVKVDLQFQGNSLQLRVTDDGCGFAPAETLATADRHCGLIMMRERAEDIRGTCTITSTPGLGTRVSATAPLVPERA